MHITMFPYHLIYQFTSSAIHIKHSLPIPTIHKWGINTNFHVHYNFNIKFRWTYGAATKRINIKVFRQIRLQHQILKFNCALFVYNSDLVVQILRNFH